MTPSVAATALASATPRMIITTSGHAAIIATISATASQKPASAVRTISRRSAGTERVTPLLLGRCVGVLTANINSDRDTVRGAFAPRP
jgi:hypothetical protein